MPAKKKTVKQKQQKMFTFGEAIASFWNKYIVFSGTAQRSEFWWWFLFDFLISAAISIVFAFAPFTESLADKLWAVATIIPWLALTSRRFHDAGFSSLWFFIPLLVYSLLFPVMFALTDVMMTDALAALSLLSVAGFCIFWFVVTLLPSKTKDNPYRK